MGRFAYQIHNSKFWDGFFLKKKKKKVQQFPGIYVL